MELAINLDFSNLAHNIKPAFLGADDGEIFIEKNLTESIEFESSNIKSTSFNTCQGFGLRRVAGERVDYAYSSEIGENSIKNAVRLFSNNELTHTGGVTVDLSPGPDKVQRTLYSADCCANNQNFLKESLIFLDNADKFIRAFDNRVSQVIMNISRNISSINITRPDGFSTSDIRPIINISITIITCENARQEMAVSRFGGRQNLKNFFEKSFWQPRVSKAVERALLKLNSVPAPIGEMPVILGSGWAGVLLHEAIGHGLEGDAIRKKTSVFSNMLGQEVASKLVTIYDDGTIANRRGSLNFDDEGTPTQKTLLVDEGKLVGFMYDRLNARLMNMPHSTGNGRRQNFMNCPIPRMTNTFMSGGDTSFEEMLSSVKKGIFALSFDGGQVDITSGKFVFIASDAFLVENGKILQPIKGVSLIGNGPDILKKVKMIGNDFALDDGIGTCGKDGQNVPCGVGQPSILLDAITVGGNNN